MTGALSFHDPRAALYIRASTEDQKLTLDGQEFEGREWAERHGVKVAGVFLEPAVSGSRPFLQRKRAKQCLAWMKQQGIPCLLVLNLHRGFRDVDDMRQTVDHLIDEGMSLRIASPDIDARGGYGKFLATVLAAVAEMQLHETKDQQRRAFDQMRRDRIARSQHAPFGWDMGDEVTDKTSKGGKPYRRLVSNPREQAVLREIIARYERNETLQAIADSLNERGVKTKRAGQTMIRKGKTIPISGVWKPATVKSAIEHADLDDEPTQAPPQDNTP